MKKTVADLLVLGIKVRFLECWEWLRVIWRYSRFSGFLPSYLLLFSSYLWSGPYSISRRYLKWQGAEDVYAYGETPLTTLDRIASRVGLKAGDHVFELGAGSGYTSLWLHHVPGCRVTAVEIVPGFSRRLGAVVKWRKLAGVEVRAESYLDTPLVGGADCVYLYASNLDDSSIEVLVKHLARLEEGVKVVTISYSLTDYDTAGTFKQTDQFKASFPWGKADVFVQVRTSGAQRSVW